MRPKNRIFIKYGIDSLTEIQNTSDRQVENQKTGNTRHVVRKAFIKQSKLYFFVQTSHIAKPNTSFCWTYTSYHCSSFTQLLGPFSKEVQSSTMKLSKHSFQTLTLQFLKRCTISNIELNTLTE